MCELFVNKKISQFYKIAISDVMGSINARIINKILCTIKTIKCQMKKMYFSILQKKRKWSD